MIKRVRILRALLLLAAMAAGLLAWQYYADQAAEEKSLAAAAALSEGGAEWAEGMEAGLAFVLPVEESLRDGPLPAFGLRWIESSEKGDGPNYALFLPAAAKATGLQAFVNGTQLTLDGEPLTSGQRLAFTPSPKEHLLVEEEGPYPGKEWRFVVLYGSEIPCIFLETFSGSMDAIWADKEYSESASVTLLEADGSVEYCGSIEAMHGRGNVTWEGAKKPYQITLSEKVSLLEMPAARRWLLIGNTFDKSLLRNQVVFAIAREAGLAFTPQSRQAELYINGEYQGCYLLCEKVELRENRVDLPDLDEANDALSGGSQQPGPDLLLYDAGTPGQPGHIRYAQPAGEAEGRSGGYLLEYDLPERFLAGKNAGFITRMGQPVCIKSPSYPSQAQVEYIAALCQKLEDLLYPPDGEPAAGGLADIIDLQSFVRKYLVEEIVKNMDANVSSQYLYKMPDSADTRLFAGPVWDYDTSLGGEGVSWYDISERILPEGFWANQQQSEYSLWSGLYRQQEFREAVKTSFFEEFVPLIGQMLEESWICSDGRRILDSAKMDAQRWQGAAYGEQAFVQEYQQEVAGIEEFLAARMAFLTEEWSKEAS